jgi:hypothetical protein
MCILVYLVHAYWVLQHHNWVVLDLPEMQQKLRIQVFV